MKDVIYVLPMSNSIKSLKIQITWAIQQMYEGMLSRIAGILLQQLLCYKIRTHTALVINLRTYYGHFACFTFLPAIKLSHFLNLLFTRDCSSQFKTIPHSFLTLSVHAQQYGRHANSFAFMAVASEAFELRCV